MSLSPTQQQPRISPFRNFIASVLFAWATIWLYGLGQRGIEVAALASVVTGLISGVQFIRGLNAWDHWRDQRRLRRQFERFGHAHGQSRLGTLKDAEDAGLTGENGFFVGRMDGQDLCYPGENHVLICAPPGTKKTTSIAIPNLLRNWGSLDESDWPGSIITADVKGELSACTISQQRRLGRKVVTINPHRQQLSAELGIDVGDTKFNPWGWIKHDSPQVLDDVKLASLLTMPGSPKERSNANSEFFERAGRTALTGIGLDELSRNGIVTLPALRRRLMVAGDELLASIGSMVINSAYGGAVSEYGKRLEATLTNAPEQFAGGWENAQEAVEIYDSYGPLGQHVSKNEFDFRLVKQEPTAVYIMLPNDKGGQSGIHSAWMNLVMSTAMEQVARDRSHRRVTFLLDEFVNLGYMPRLLHAMSEYRSFGVQIVTISQQLSQIEQLYGRASLRSMFGMSEVIQLFALRELEDLKMVSELTGMETVPDGSMNVRSGPTSGMASDVSYTGSFRSRPVLRPEDIRTIPDEKQLIIYRNRPVFLADKVDYLTHPQWQHWADPNPYYARR